LQSTHTAAAPDPLWIKETRPKNVLAILAKKHIAIRSHHHLGIARPQV
jgi:hypothetical protein